jgi:energy-coupling factor transport system ATP-binding protein
MSFIKAENLFFKYKEEETEVLKNISLAIEKGSYTAILGHNGSGKSTLAKLLCGILQPTWGTVTIGGLDTRNEENLYKIRETCGMVFQNPDNQIVASVVEEDVAFAPENLGVAPAEIRKIVDNCLKTVGMEEYALHSTYKLSGGQKQRIAIAGVLAMSPECIIFDEATAMLDPNGRKEINQAMKKLNREKGITVITITHYMNEAIEADRVVVLNKGEVFLDGTPKQIFSQVEKLKSVSLSVPQVTELLHQLGKDGYTFPEGILHTMEAAEAIECKVLEVRNQ